MLTHQDAAPGTPWLHTFCWGSWCIQACAFCKSSHRPNPVWVPGVEGWCVSPVLLSHLRAQENCPTSCWAGRKWTSEVFSLGCWSLWPAQCISQTVFWKVPSTWLQKSCLAILLSPPCRTWSWPQCPLKHPAPRCAESHRPRCSHWCLALSWSGGLWGCCPYGSWWSPSIWPQVYSHCVGDWTCLPHSSNSTLHGNFLAACIHFERIRHLLWWQRSFHKALQNSTRFLPFGSLPTCAASLCHLQPSLEICRSTYVALTRSALTRGNAWYLQQESQICGLQTLEGLGGASGCGLHWMKIAVISFSAPECYLLAGMPHHPHGEWGAGTCHILPR